MCYNSAHDELFLADLTNDVVRSMHLRDNAVDLLDVYKVSADNENTTPIICSVCHMRDTDTLLVCSGEVSKTSSNQWLVALSRNGSDWSEAHRVQIQGTVKLCGSFALSDSRVLVGEYGSTYMELFRVESGPRVAHSRIQLLEHYLDFSATSSSVTLVATCFKTDKWVRVYRLLGDWLEELAYIRFKKKEPCALLWLDDRILLVETKNADSSAIIALEFVGTQLLRRHEFNSCNVYRWCTANNGIAIVEIPSKDLLHFSFS